MSEVFVSYKREDRPRVEPMVEALRHAGLTVAWDRDIPGASQWRQELTRHLETAGCVIVVWSEASTGPEGAFVHDEAGRARQREVLLPVCIDAVALPLGFGEIQSLDLVDWAGEADDPRFQEVVAAARAMTLGSAKPEPFRPPTPRPKNVFARLARLVTNYFSDLLALTSGPKRFVADRIAGSGLKARDAFLFLALSSLLTSAMAIPLGLSPLAELPSDLVMIGAYSLLFGYAAYFSWRAVGAGGKVQDYLAIHFYLAGVLKLIQTTTFVVALGALRVADPAAHQELMDKLVGGGVVAWVRSNLTTLYAEHPAWWLVFGVTMAGYVAMFVWILVGWGAYRQLAGQRRLRSLLAFVMFCALCVPIYALIGTLAAALIR